MAHSTCKSFIKFGCFLKWWLELVVFLVHFFFLDKMLIIPFTPLQEQGTIYMEFFPNGRFIIHTWQVILNRSFFEFSAVFFSCFWIYRASAFLVDFHNFTWVGDNFIQAHLILPINFIMLNVSPKVNFFYYFLWKKC